MDDDGLTDKQRCFVAEYLIDLNATQAAIRAGYGEATARDIGCENLAKPNIAAAIAQAQAERAARVGVTADAVLARWWAIATADPNDLIEHRRVCCRHCWGEGHRYQFTPDEHTRAVRAWARGRREGAGPSETHGGIGFDAMRDPHPDCPECGGDGVCRVHTHDTRTLTGGARLLYRGTKRTRDGIETLMEDQVAALVNVTRHLGMFVVRRVVDMPGDAAPVEASEAIDLSRLDLAGRAALAALGVEIYEGGPQ